MRQQHILFCIFFIYISVVHTGILYQCNFDSLTENCFTSEMNVSSNIGIPNFFMPNAPLSDVTSSLKPTDNGEVCELFYRIDTYTWDMYFCNRGFCPTETNPNSRCQSGYFGFVYLNDNNRKTFQLKIELNKMNRVNQQCLIYYYYMPNISEKIIIIRKEEITGESETIDSITNSPFNGWIQRKISFNVQQSNYKIYFQVQKLSKFSTFYIGFDEISIMEGACDDHIVLEDLTFTNITITTEDIITSSIMSTTTPTMTDTSSLTTTETDHTSLFSTTIPMDTSLSTITPVPVDTSTSETQEISSSITTPIPMDTSTSETQDTSSSTTTPITMDTSSSMMTSMLSDSSSSAITSESTDMTYSDEISSEKTTEFSTESSSMISTEISSIESDTTELSSSSLSTTIIISSTNTDITEITNNSSTEFLTTNEASTISILTTTKDNNVIITSYDEILPYETHHIIIMAVLIPLLWIAFIVSFFWAKRSTDIIGSILHPFNNFSRGGKTWGSYELENILHA